MFHADGLTTTISHVTFARGVMQKYEDWQRGGYRT
jgi:hypothetical protein